MNAVKTEHLHFLMQKLHHIKTPTKLTDKHRIMKAYNFEKGIKPTAQSSSAPETPIIVPNQTIIKMAQT